MIEQYISNIDTLRFGFKIAKINSFSENTKSIIHQLKNEGVKLIIARINAEDIKALNRLEQIGFLIKDVQLIYNFDLKSKSVFDLSNRIIIRDFKSDDVQQIQEIAKQSFVNYGHYFNDDNLDKEKCIDIYTDWAYNCCTNKNVADNVIVAEIDGIIAGFLAFKNFGDQDYSFASLGAVNSRFRKLGVFQEINIAGLNWVKSMRINNVQTSVLNTNYPVNKTYCDLGFKIIKSSITMHCWL